MQVNIYEAKSQFSRLVERSLQGEEVIIAKAGKPLLRLLPIAGPGEGSGVRFGGLRNAGIRVDEDFYLPDSDADLLDVADQA